MATTIFFSEGPFTYVSPVSYMSGLPVDTEITSAKYMEFAARDLSSSGTEAVINALGHAKRAMHLMIDTLLQNFGMLRHNSRLSFPAKLELLDSVGLISLKVFQKLNVERNVVEHDYKLPRRDKVEDFVDVCQLLMLATERLGESIPRCAIVGWRSDGSHQLLELEPGLGRIDFYGLSDVQTYQNDVFGTPVEFAAALLIGGHRGPPAVRDSEPSSTFDLKASSRGEWAPLLHDLAQLPSEAERVTDVHEGIVTLWTSKAIATADLATSKLGHLLGVSPESRDSFELVIRGDASVPPGDPPSESGPDAAD